MRVTIGNQAYSIGLTWQLAASWEDIAERREETGHERGVVLKAGKSIVGVGFAEDDGRDPPPSAAAWLALCYPGETVLAIEWVDNGADKRYWLAAVSDGAVVSGTDVLMDDPALIRRHIQDLVADFGCTVMGGASEAFGGSGESALKPVSRAGIRSASIRRLNPTNLVQVAFLVLLVICVAAATWLLLQPDQSQTPLLPSVDQQAEQRKLAIAERNRQLSTDLSGLSTVELAGLTRAAAKPLERSAAMWKLTRKRCDGGGAGNCTLTWQAISAVATPLELSSALGIERERLGHDLRAETVTVTDALGGSGHTVEADESTLLGGQIPTLVDRCRRYNGLGGECALDAPLESSLSSANAAALPAGLKYRRGRITVAGPLGRMEALLPVFANGLDPWVRAEVLDLDLERLEFRLEGHYVIP